MPGASPESPRRTFVLLFGGRSAEHDVSCVSARHVLAAVDTDRYDIVPVGITRAGDPALRSMLVTGAMAVIRQAERNPAKASPWLLALLKRKPKKLAAVALANKNARIAWKLMISGQRYNPNHGALANAAAA